MRQSGAPADEGIIVELLQNGAYVKATAIDPRTGIEATIVGAASSPPTLLRNAAAKKLKYVLAKQKNL